MHKTQVFFIHGGMTFKNNGAYLKFLKDLEVYLEKYSSWSGAYLEKSLGRNFIVISPRFPQKDNAQYKEWKIIFEKYLKLLKGRAIFIGYSLGGIFLARYLSENKLVKQAKAVFLISPPFDNTDTLPNEGLYNGFKLKNDLSLLEKNCKNLYLMFSRDDDIVPVSHAEKYRKKLPQAKIIIYKSKNGHFRVKTFPELIKLIKEKNKKK